MDKYEYKLCSEEIKSLIKKRNFRKAMEIADTVDWTRVRSVSTLCTISDLYKINQRYKESKALLQQAYERYPGGRMIVYSLCELCIKMDEIVQAIEYYKEFVQMAPTDNGKFILQYKIYEAQDVSLEERIAVLEELKKRDYREKWGYELAYLYHRIGLTTKCVEECDQLVLWFREGKYVKKAMELKMLHQALSQEQEIIYQSMLPEKEQRAHIEQTTVYQKPEEPEIHVKTMDVGKYNTINLQKELAESMKEVLVAENGFKPLMDENANEESKPGAVTQAIMAPMMQDTGEMEELFFEEEPVSEVQPVQGSEIRASHGDAVTIVKSDFSEMDAQKLVEAAKEPIVQLINKKVAEAVESAINEERPTIREVMKTQINDPDLSKVEPPYSMGRMLSQEYDGQISLVVPESERVEKQITGQMNLEEILNEWEKTKKQYEEKKKEEVKRRVLEQTGNLFTDFDAQVRDGILEKLEKENHIRHTAIDADKEYRDYLEQVSADEDSEELPEVEELEEIKEVDESNDTQTEEPITEKPEEVESVDEKQEEPEPEEEPVDEKQEEPEPEEEPVAEKLEEESEPEEEPVDEKQEEESEPEKKKEEIGSNRNFTEEETALFAPFIQTKAAKQKLLKELDSISLVAYTGNVFVTGETQDETMELAKSVIREIQLTDHNFSGKIARVTGSALNTKDVTKIVEKLTNGGLIIERAFGMDDQTTKNLLKALNQEKTGIVVVLQDTKKAMNKMKETFEGMAECFNVHIEVEELSDDALVTYGRKYAEHLEYSIDEMGILALHTRIDELQTSDHIVTVSDVREIVDEAIEHANKKNLKHFSDILFAKRYDDDDMIILRERDFLE